MNLLASLLLLHASPFHESELWPSIRRHTPTEIREMTKEREREIALEKERWADKLAPLPFQKEVQQLLQEGNLLPITSGKGSTYLLQDSRKSPRYILKPFDEAPHCLKNPKGSASPLRSLAHRVRPHIPLYRSHLCETLTSKFAEILGFGRLTPKTELTLLEIEGEEKLCTIQPYKENLIPLSVLAKQWIESKGDPSSLSQRDVEELCLLIWLVQDTDAHAENLHAFEDPSGAYHLVKLDNSLTFPAKNGYLKNALILLPHADEPLSERAREQISALPIKTLIEAITTMGLEDTVAAFLQRVKRLQELCQSPHLSIREIDIALQAMRLAHY